METIGLFGFNKQKWISVNRTLKFYTDVLRSYFSLSYLSETDQDWHTRSYAAVINVNSSKCWDIKPHPDFPLIFVMNGGLILDQTFLRRHLSNLETADVLIVNCSSDVSILRRILTVLPRICLLPLPVDLKIFKPLQKDKCRSYLPVSKSDYTIGFIGRLLPQKNLHQFLRLLFKLKKAVYPRRINAIVVGSFWIDYPILPYVTESYPDNIKILIHKLNLSEDVCFISSNLDDDDLAIIYNSLDLLIHPTHSIDENFGYVPVEAMACGIPVIGSAYGGLKDYVIHGETGYLIPTWATSAGIRMEVEYGFMKSLSLLRNKKLWLKLSHACIHRAHNYHTFSECSKILINSIKGAIRHRSTGRYEDIKISDFGYKISEEKYLPDTSKSWEDYHAVVSNYASNTVPIPHLSSFVRLYGPVTKKDEKYVLNDDAWPAEYPINMVPEIVLERCTKNTLVCDLINTGSISLRHIAKLVEVGLLICS